MIVGREEGLVGKGVDLRGDKNIVVCYSLYGVSNYDGGYRLLRPGDF